MLIAIPKEIYPGETRVAMIPANVHKLVQLGAEMEIESTAGISSGWQDEDYIKVGARVNTDRKAMLSRADMVLRLRKPPKEEISWLKPGALHISHLHPFYECELMHELARCNISAISMEMIPRISRAQKMDALSSQANLAGYVAVILAAARMNKIFPMMTTAAGTIQPVRVFVIGAGVAGLQAIATAKRLGARVYAYDTRPVVEEQVQSLGAKFVKIDLGNTGETKQGYAKALTEEQINQQREAMTKHCSLADVVITTAQLFGRKAPIIITQDMIAAMRPGSVIVDLAVESGGNVEGAMLDQECDINGVLIIGLSNLPGHVAAHASQMYSTNLYNLIYEFWDSETQTFRLKLEDDIIKGCLVTHQEYILHQCLKQQEKERSQRLDNHPCTNPCPYYKKALG